MYIILKKSKLKLIAIALLVGVSVKVAALDQDKQSENPPPPPQTSSRWCDRLIQKSLNNCALEVIKHFNDNEKSNLQPFNYTYAERNAHISCFFKYEFDGFVLFFRPRVTPQFFSTDVKEYKDNLIHKYTQEIGENVKEPPSFFNGIEAPSFFELNATESEIRNAVWGMSVPFMERCYRSLLSFTTLEALNNFKKDIKNITESAFEIYKLIMADDRDSLFYPLPPEMKNKILEITYKG